MSRYIESHTLSHILVGRLHVFAIAVLLAGALSLTPGRAAQAAEATQGSDLLQFTAAGHILGFQAQGVYVASGDHMLRVEFAGTRGVTPVADRTPRGEGQAQPLGRVTYPDLWPGISLSYEQVARGIVQSFYRLEPGADAGQIRLHYNAPLEIEAGGSLRIQYETGHLRESAPIAWQDIDGQRLPVEVSFRLVDSATRNSVVGFALGGHNPAYPVTIDPVLAWNTFMGSPTHFDEGRGIAVDGSGKVYVTGWSAESWGTPVNPHAGGADDAFVAKLNSSGALLWNTFMGSSGVEYGVNIAVDGSGKVYVTGLSSGTWGTPVNPHAGGADVFVAKLNSNGVLQWNTFMGSDSGEYGLGIAVNENGDLYVSGTSDGTWGSPVNPHAGGLDVFVAKLDSTGVLEWNTFMGSSDVDEGGDVALDESGKVYVTARSSETWGTPVNPHAGGADAFVAKLDSSGALLWNTFMGSSGYDSTYGIAVNGSGDVYVPGHSDETWGSPVNPHAGGESDAFVAKLDSSGALLWNTFMGSSGNDGAGNIAVDSRDNLYVVGMSDATWGHPVYPYAGGYDAFVANLNSSGVLEWSTFLGSPSEEWGGFLTLDGNGNVYVAGTSDATWGSPVNPHEGWDDAFVAKLAPLQVPTMSRRGLILFFTVLAGSGAWLIRRRAASASL